MKRIILFAIASMALVSCLEEKMDITEVKGSGIEMTISAMSEVDTKTHLDVKTVNWNPSDVLGLYDGTGIRQFTTSEEAIDGASATFTGEAAEQDVYYAVYPYNENVKFDADTKTFSTHIPTVQTASAANGFMDGANISVAKAAKGASYIFRNVCSYIKVNVTEANVKQVVVKSTSGKKLLTGKVKVTVTDDAPVTTVYDGSTLVYLNPASGSDYIAQGTYYITVAPQNLNASEYTIRKVYDSTMKVWTGTKALELNRNTPVNFGDLAAADFTWEEFTQVDLHDSKVFKMLKYVPSGGSNGEWDLLTDGKAQSGAFLMVNQGTYSSGAKYGSPIRWDFNDDYKPSALIFEYTTAEYYTSDKNSTYYGYPTPGYNLIPWTVSIADPINGATTLIKELTVENDALPWESLKTYTSDIITSTDGVLDRFQISCHRTRKNPGPGVSPKDATDVEYRQFGSTVYSWALAELTLWTKK